MNEKLGYRVYIVGESSIARLSQKVFSAFWFRKEPALPGEAGKTILLAMVMYTLQDRKPLAIVRIDTMRCRVLSGGALDNAYSHEGIRLALDRMGGPVPKVVNANVVDAIGPFREKKWRDHHPALSGPAHKRILVDLFGHANVA